MKELIEMYKLHKSASNTTMMNYAKNRLIRFHNYYIEEEG